MNVTNIIEEDFYHILDIGEGEDVEFKSAKGGFPKSFWETYSAFANTHGGVIVLGVKEEETFVPTGLTKEEAAKLKQKFWNDVNNRDVISACILTNDDVCLKETSKGYVVLFKIPQASRNQRPIFRKRIPHEGTYRRNDSGDYRCTTAEVRRMMIDADILHPADSRILQGFTWEDIDIDSFMQYRRLFYVARPDHPWLDGDDDTLLRKLGGYRKDRETGEEGFTLAGLLMFGKYQSIVAPSCAPHFFPDYRDYATELSERWKNRICPDGTWEANLFQFYRRVLPKLQADLPIPFRLEQGQRMDNTPAHEALREAMANLCVHTDYTEEGALTISKYTDKILFSNPGTLLISREQFYRGGESVCRNPSLQQMFMMMGAVEKAGSGIDKILRGWQESHWKPPYPNELLRPNKVELVMPLVSLFDTRTITGLQQLLGSTMDTLDAHERILLATVFTEERINHQRLKELLSLHNADITIKLRELTQKGILVAEGYGRGRIYHLPQIPPTLQVHASNLATSDPPTLQVHTSNLATSDPPTLQVHASNLATPDPPTLQVHASNLATSDPPTLQVHASNLATSDPPTLQVHASNLATSDPPTLQAHASNLATSDPPTLQARVPKFSVEERTSLVTQFCTEWRTSQQIAEHLQRNSSYIRNNVLPPLVASGVLEMMFPTKNHPNQKYKTRQS